VPIGFLVVFAVLAALVLVIPGTLLVGAGLLSLATGTFTRLMGGARRFWVPLALPGIVLLPMGAVAIGLAMVCAGIAVLAALLFAMQVSSVPVEAHGDDARPHFRNAFGFDAGPDVRDLHTLNYVFVDSGVLLVRFEAAPATVDRILTQGLEPADCVDFDSETKRPIAGKPAPQWWAPPSEGRTCYRASSWPNGFSSSGAGLCRSTSQRALFFYSHGID